MAKSSKDGRPSPPSDLSPIQKRIWRNVVSSEPASYFESPANQLLLVEFCRHVQTAGFLGAIIAQMETSAELPDAREYAKLLALRETATRTLTSVATRLRLTNQSRYTPQAAATAAKGAGSGSRPWDYER